MTRADLRQALADAPVAVVHLAGRLRGRVDVHAPSVDANGVLRGRARGLVLEGGQLRAADAIAIVASDVTRVELEPVDAGEDRRW